MFVRYSSVISQFVNAQCTCERCGNPIQCELFIEGYSSANSSSLFTGLDAAKQKAAMGAQESFEQSKKDPQMIPLPCPSCGWFQSKMVKYHKATIFPELFRNSCMILIFSIFMFAIQNGVLYFNKITPDSSFETFVKYEWLALALLCLTVITIKVIRVRSDLNANPLIKRIKRPSA